MDLHTYSETLDATSAERMREHMDRVQREEREWMEARLHHALHGSWLALKSIFRCHTWGGQGYDPVPDKRIP